MMNAQPVVNNYQKRRQDDNLKMNEEENDNTTKSESQLLKDQIDKLALEFTPKLINYVLIIIFIYFLATKTFQRR